MIDRLVLLGATGDLSGRFVLPALAALADAGKLPDDFEIVGGAPSRWDDARFRDFAAKHLDRHATSLPATARERVLGSLRYSPVDASDAASVAGVVADRAESVAVYLALPPRTYPAAVSALSHAGLGPKSRLAFEKPFGESLEAAETLNAQLTEAFDESQIFRVDHALGMVTTENLLALRFANRVLEPLWSSEHIAEVELLWEETLALEDRAGYYDDAGALEDVMQNHLLQLLALVAMEPGSEPLRDRKSAVLRAVQPIDVERTRRARYTAGRLSDDRRSPGREVPAYVDEAGVDPGKGTETFGEIVLEIDNPRWRGARFVLRAGKALAERRKGVVVRFRPSSQPPSGRAPDEGVSNTLRIGIDGPTEISLQLTGSFSEPPRPDALVLETPSLTGKLPPYGRVLEDFLTGGDRLAVGPEEAVLAWGIVTPVLEAWRANVIALLEYPAGSAGP